MGIIVLGGRLAVDQGKKGVDVRLGHIHAIANVNIRPTSKQNRWAHFTFGRYTLKNGCVIFTGLALRLTPPGCSGLNAAMAITARRNLFRFYSANERKTRWPHLLEDGGLLTTMFTLIITPRG